MTVQPQAPLLRLAGEPYTLGRLHGEARAAALRAFLDDALGRLNHLLPAPVTMADLLPRVAAYRAEVAASFPELAEEVRGLADGAGIGEEQGWLLQLRREFLGYLKIPTLGDCTTWARSGAAAGGNPVLAQTVDLNGDLDDQIAVLEIAPAGSPRRVLMLSFAGLLGYLGVNSDGLAVGINLVLGGDWRPGLPPYLAVRHLLENASDVASACRLIEKLDLASSRSFSLCDAGTTAFAEVLEGRVRVVESAHHVHTNHYLHPELAPSDELNVFARTSSLRRLGACEAGLAALPAAAGPEECFGLLSAPPVCVPDEGDIRRERTVAAAVMLPARRELHLRPGNPAHSGTLVFTLD
ncbi:C45 family autoproteolytic acyltransferase/hydolase [Streptacidiphilus griseoplanus]|uniref:C45 family autoproteolytic acyltransferase/hydolase n=1 Tax=Peterkaempfera griseoplana TaxID=66896 RepID=UPI0006E46C92|nr:C45 family peptidase [Peterkaempfera griseoplana]